MSRPPRKRPPTIQPTDSASDPTVDDSDIAPNSADDTVAPDSENNFDTSADEGASSDSSATAGDNSASSGDDTTSQDIEGETISE